MMLMSSWELVCAVCGVHVGILLDCFLLVCVSVFAVLTLCIMKGTIAELVPLFNRWLTVTFCHRWKSGPLAQLDVAL